MALTWKDAVATLMTAGVGVITYAKLKGFDWPLVSSWRMSTLALLVLGLGTCIVVGSGAVPVKSGWTTAATFLGIVAFVLIAAGLITGNKVIFLAVAADIFALWALSTLHHALEAGA